MSRFSHYDTDDERLPEGMTRIGYDADSSTYTYRDSDGSIWEGEPGSRYGRLHRVSSPPVGPDLEDPSDATRPFLEYEGDGYDDQGNPSGSFGGKVSWRQHYMPLLNFFFIVCLFLIGVIWFLHKTAGVDSKGVDDMQCDTDAGWSGRKVVKGDTCWDLAKFAGVSVEKLLEGNKGMDCDKMRPGMQVCMPGQ
ncbi:hypothetical protein MKZ38_006131 [Zalerion maritima]|uniref:LysM domain-containing protein n=1 Tax=Zalerion maritima TaxID=339359 RepID=A0AAD5RJA1_9PEZI|nr:hypothetical protein MKZ38_006131 [Zalerion maritima]